MASLYEDCVLGFNNTHLKATVYNGEADHDREADQYNYIHGRVKQDV